jgi:hypothetical protein
MEGKDRVFVVMLIIAIIFFILGRFSETVTCG